MRQPMKLAQAAAGQGQKLSFCMPAQGPWGSWVGDHVSRTAPARGWALRLWRHGKTEWRGQPGQMTSLRTILALGLLGVIATWRTRSHRSWRSAATTRAGSRQVALSPAFRALDTHDLRRGLHFRLTLFVPPSAFKREFIKWGNVFH